MTTNNGEDVKRDLLAVGKSVNKCSHYRKLMWHFEKTKKQN